MILVFFIWRLNKQIILFRKAKKEMKFLMYGFDQSIIRAETAFDSMKLDSKEVGANLEKQIQRAKVLSNDLAFMVDKTSAINEKLSKNIDKVKKNFPENNSYNERLRIIEQEIFGKLNKINHKSASQKYVSQEMFNKKIDIDALIDKISLNQSNNHAEEREYEPMIKNKDYFYRNLKKVDRV
jgi:hypothetical protein